jgi:hypothetical protein
MPVSATFITVFGTFPRVSGRLRRLADEAGEAAPTEQGTILHVQPYTFVSGL